MWMTSVGDIRSMTPPPKEGDTSLGRILVSMGFCTAEQIYKAVEDQRRCVKDKMIGAFLMESSRVDKKQLKEALSAQEGLRSKSFSKRALAQATIAQRSGEAVSSLAGFVCGKSIELKRQSQVIHEKVTTGGGHPAVTKEMLVDD